ncbi:MAG: RNA polymerase sigma factor [Planctomycetota bacterium]|nr:RNA polymerase sigma factor [Planctomycetota bacterium]
MSVETAQLVSECLQGVPGASTRLVQQFRERVFGLCYRMLGQREDAEDATQETFIRVINNLHRWDSERSFEPWLYTIAGNRCRTRLLKRSKQKEIQLPETMDCAARPRLQTGIFEEIGIAVERLAPHQKEAFRLFHERQLSYLEIAAKLEVPVGTIKTWVHRARRQIADHLKRRKTLETD